MKKLYFMMALILCAMSATAQNYNLFSASDIDKDGWLWFDTQAKVDKYVGICDEDNYKADPYPLYTSLTILNISHLQKKLSSPVLKVVYPGRDWLL